MMERLGWITGEQADYSFADVRDSSDSNPRLRVAGPDSVALCGAVRSSAFENDRTVGKLQRHIDRGRLLLYLEKRLGLEMTPVLFQIYVVSWYATRNGTPGGPVVYFMERSVFRSWLEGFAAERGVSLRWYGFWWTNVSVPVRGPWRVTRSNAGRTFRGIAALATLVLRSRPVWSPKARRPSPAGPKAHGSSNSMVAIPYWGIGRSFDLSVASELFWVPFARLAPDQLLVYFNEPNYPLDEETYEDFRRMSVQAVALRDATRASTHVPVWRSGALVRRLVPEIARSFKLAIPVLVTARPRSQIGRWVAGKALRFIVSYTYWRCFFASFHVKVHVDLTDYNSERIAADQAIADLGGVSVSYQRSSEDVPSTLWASAVDIRFGFSPSLAEAKQQSRAYIGQLVAAGYTYDHAFSRVKSRSARLRAQLHERGARFIVCFFDGYSAEDKRKFFSHENRAEDYRFLLERLLADRSLGLIFKPKKPADLQRRLGDVSPMLEAGLATGRCFMFEGGNTLSTEALPCEASQAADVAIALLWGPTAGLESALAGTPTMFIDRAAVNYHPLYELGEGEVVFKDWDSLWERLEACRKDPTLMPWFGNGSPNLSKFDPFRDGRAAERIGSYIGSMARELGDGLSPSDAMARVRERYVATWGADKEVSLR